MKQPYLSLVEATRIREKYGCEPPLGFVKTTKPVLIQAGTSREIHGLTKIKHGGYAVNCISEPAIGQQLPKRIEIDSRVFTPESRQLQSLSCSSK